MELPMTKVKFVPALSIPYLRSPKFISDWTSFFNMSKQPFIYSNYSLNTSQLRPLTQAETVTIAQTLVKIEPWENH